MKSRNIFLSSLALAALLFGSLAAFIPATSAGGNKKELTACEKEDLKYQPQIRAFNRAFNSAAIFKAAPTLQDIQRSYSTRLARLKYGELSPEKRRAVWKAKFDQVDLSDLNPIQSEYLERIVASLDSMKFDGTDDRQSAVSLALEGRNLFKKSEFLNLFGSLKTTAGIMKTSAQIVPECHCNNETYGGWVDDFCPTIYPYNLRCNSTATVCIRTNPGCGWLWSWVCNGLCLPVQ